MNITQLSLRKIKRTPFRFCGFISASLLAGTSLFASDWFRNTTPSAVQMMVENPGAGWDHVQAMNVLGVSPHDKNFIVFSENVNATIITEDGLNFRPLVMPYANNNNVRPMHLTFSTHDPDAFYFLIVPGKENWATINHRDKWPMGVWRTPDRGVTWNHIYRIPAGEYERINNTAGKAVIQEDPHDGNIVYFATSSHGIVRLTRNPSTGAWASDNLVPDFEDRRIKTILAGQYQDTKTILYTLVEKKMPHHVNEETVAAGVWAPDKNYFETWDFERKLIGKEGTDLTGGSVAWSDRAAQTRYSALFDGSTRLQMSKFSFPRSDVDNYDRRLAVSVWIKTTDDSDQVILSYDKNKFFELGINGPSAAAGKVYWTLCDPTGATHTLTSPEIVSDGDWHNVVGTFNVGVFSLFVDGVKVDTATLPYNTFGKSGESASGYIGGNEADTGGNFNGRLDEVKLYNEKEYTDLDATVEYVHTEKKGPLPACTLWKVIIDGSSVTAERLQDGYEDFNKISIAKDANGNATSGWVIRRAVGNSNPYGGRHIDFFSEYGATFVNKYDKDDLETRKSFLDILVNPNDSNHLVVWTSETLPNALRYSFDGGATWGGKNRLIEDNGTPEDSEDDYVPSIMTLTAHQHELIGKGVLASETAQNKGKTIDFIPDSDGDGRDEVIWFHPTQGGLMKSWDGGENFMTGFTGGPIKETAQFAVSPADNKYRSIGTAENGIVSTIDGGLSWVSDNYNNNPALTAITDLVDDVRTFYGGARFFYGLAYHPTDPETLIGLYTDQGYIMKSEDGGRDWSNLSQGDEYVKMEKNLDPDKGTPMAGCVYWSESNPNLIYAGHKKSEDGGVTWTDMDKYIVAMSAANDQIVVGLENLTSVLTEPSLKIYLSVEGGDSGSWKAIGEPAKETAPGETEAWHVVSTTKAPNQRYPSNLIAIDPTSTTTSVRLLLPGRSGIYEFNTEIDGVTGDLIGPDWESPDRAVQNLIANPHFVDETDQFPYMALVAFDPRPGYENVVYAAANTDDFAEWVSEKNPNKPYPGGSHPAPLHVSYDSGETWQNMHHPDHSGAPGGIVVKDLTVDMNGQVYAVTQHGIYSLGSDIDFINQPPVWAEDPFRAPDAEADVTYDRSHRWRVSDPEDDDLTFAKVSGPDWVTITAWGRSQGTPGQSDAGEQQVVISVSDGINPAVTATMEIYVAPPANYAPVWDEDPFTAPNAEIGVVYARNNKWRVTDAEGDDLSFAKVSGPAWVSINGNGKAMGTPAAGDVGLNTVVISVTDGVNDPVEATMFITVE